MTGQHSDRDLTKVQIAANQFANAESEERPRALEELAKTILEHYSLSYETAATSKLLAPGLPSNVQRPAAVWVLWCLTRSPDSLTFGDARRLAAALFDRVFQNDVYKHISIEPGNQTFEKLQGLIDHFQSVLDAVYKAIHVTPDLGQVRAFQQVVMGVLNRDTHRPLLMQLLPRQLTHKAKLNALFQAIVDYAGNTDADPIQRRDTACDACDEFESDARAYGTTESDRLLGELARRLKSAVTSHFDSLEASKSPRLTFSPIAKKYPLERPDTTITFKIKIGNEGSGPARDLRLDEVASDECLSVHTSLIELGTLQARDSFVLDIDATVLTSCSEATLLAQLSWARPGGRVEETREFTVVAQRHDVNWDQVELTEPYSLEAVTTENELIGRKDELKRLLRLTNLQTVGSGLIYGQKRVGKTSLANAVEENLKSDSGQNWIVVNKGSGDYVGDDAASTLRTLGNVLVQGMKQRIPGLADVPAPDFTNGLSPISGFVDQALALDGLRLLFVLDEFDELPPELFKRTDLATALFQPLRQISNKRGCGFLLIGGEGMQQIVSLQGDRLNKFTPIELDYFSKSSDWSDFVELIRRPVEGWLTISDAALDELFAASAGNPYFAKLLARQLFTDMVGNRYSDASEVDMAEAINKALTSIGANSFAHFWTDGLSATSDDADEIRFIRRSVLIALGKAFRKHITADQESVWEEFRNVTGLPVEEHRFKSALQEFIARKVLVENEQGNITPKILLFRSWLKDKGVGELLADSRERDYLQSALQDEEKIRVKNDEIVQWCERVSNFRFLGRVIEPSHVRNWLEQFDSYKDQRLMFRLLSGVSFYDENTVRAKMNVAFELVRRNIRTAIEPKSRSRRDILVSSLDDSPAKSGLTYCRLFASENQVYHEAVQPLRSLERTLAGDLEIQRLVLIDDFSGTGRTLVDGLQSHKELLLRVNSAGIRIVLIAVVGFGQARSRAERAINRLGLQADVYFCDELGPEHEAFSETSAIFPDATERQLAKQVAESKGILLEQKHPLGYQGTQATVVFHQSCPNNTLPIFWSRKDGWAPLFPRA